MAENASSLPLSYNLRLIKGRAMKILRSLVASLLLLTMTAGAESIKPCAGKALNLLKQRDKTGYEIVTRVNDMAFFSTWLFCDNPPTYSISAAVHETNHKLSFMLSDYVKGSYGYYLGNGQIIKVPQKHMFYRSEIAQYLDSWDKGMSYYEIYLKGDSGKQDITVLLDELNAYIHSTNTSVKFVDLNPRNLIQSERDGLATFMYYVELYLKKARLSHTKQWESICSDEEYMSLLKSLWQRAEETMESALKYPQLGQQDKFIIKKIYESQNINELVKTFDEAGLTFAYDKEILKKGNSLDQQKSTNKRGNNNKIIKQQKSITTISINGKNMSMKEFVKYLNQHPELKNNPQMKEILNKMNNN